MRSSRPKMTMSNSNSWISSNNKRCSICRCSNSRRWSCSSSSSSCSNSNNCSKMPPSWTNLLERTFEIAEAEQKHILKAVDLRSQEEETRLDQVQDQDMEVRREDRRQGAHWILLDLIHSQLDQQVQVSALSHWQFYQVQFQRHRRPLLWYMEIQQERCWTTWFLKGRNQIHQRKEIAKARDSQIRAPATRTRNTTSTTSFKPNKRNIIFWISSRCNNNNTCCSNNTNNKCCNMMKAKMMEINMTWFSKMPRIRMLHLTQEKPSSMRLRRSRKMERARTSSRISRATSWTCRLLMICRQSKSSSFCKMLRTSLKMVKQMKTCSTRMAIQSSNFQRRSNSNCSKFSKRGWCSSNSSSSSCSSSSRCRTSSSSNRTTHRRSLSTNEFNHTKTSATSWLKAWARPKQVSPTWHLEHRRRAQAARPQETPRCWQRQNLPALKLTRESWSKRSNLRLCWDSTRWTRRCKIKRSFNISNELRKWRSVMKRLRQSNRRSLRSRCWTSSDLKCSSGMLSKSVFAKKYTSWLPTSKRTNC